MIYRINLRFSMLSPSTSCIVLANFALKVKKISFCVHFFYFTILAWYFSVIVRLTLQACNLHTLCRALHTFFGHWSNLVSVKIIANCTLYVWHQSQWKVSKPPGWSFSDLFNATGALFHLLTNLPQNSSRTNMFYGWPSITCLHWHSFVDCNQHWECGHHGECKKSRKYYDDGFYKRDSDVEKRSKLVPK